MNHSPKTHDGPFQASESLLEALQQTNPEKYEVVAWIEGLAKTDKELYEAILCK